MLLLGFLDSSFQVSNAISEYFYFISESYLKPSLLFILIPSQRGVQQDLTFTLSHFDDVTLCGRTFETLF